MAGGHSKLLLPAHLVTKEDAADASDVTDNILKSLNKQPFNSSDGKRCENYLPAVVDDEALSEIPIHRSKSLTQKHISEQRKSLDSKQLSTSYSLSVPPDRKPVANNPHNLQVGAMIQFGNPPCYGIIKWIGSLSSYGCLMAGVEVV